jgi:23S rRNA pseudouridine1911/1915/1917 synthase
VTPGRLIDGELGAAARLRWSEPRSFTIGQRDAGHRLDVVATRHLASLPAASRSRIQRWITAGRVSRNGSPVHRPGARLRPGDRIDIALPAPPPPLPAPPPEPLPITVLWQDEHFLAVAKPAGLEVHPTSRRRQGTLLNGLLALAEGWPPGERPHLVQRLDRGTSGVLWVARHGPGHGALARRLAAPGARKEYLAVVYGVPEQVRGSIRLPLERDPAHPSRRRVSRTGGQDAITRFELLASTAGPGVRLSLLSCRLVTGRTHQIRVHLAARRLPLVGDPLYGAPLHHRIADPLLAAACRALPRQALHAWRVACIHPWSGQPLVVECPPPADLAAVLVAAGFLRGLGGGPAAAPAPLPPHSGPPSPRG